jgi:hypothetical protein
MTRRTSSAVVCCGTPPGSAPDRSLTHAAGRQARARLRYKRLDDPFRLAYCELWSALVTADVPAIRR